MIRRWFRAVTRTGSLVRPTPLSSPAGRRGRTLLRLEAVEDRTLASITPVDPPEPVPAPDQSQITSVPESSDPAPVIDQEVPLPTDGWNTSTPPTADADVRTAADVAMQMTFGGSATLNALPAPASARFSGPMEKAAVEADPATKTTAPADGGSGTTVAAGATATAGVAVDEARSSGSTATQARADRPAAPAGRPATAVTTATVRADAGQPVHRPVNGKVLAARPTADDAGPARSGRETPAVKAAASAPALPAADLSDGALLHRFVAHREQAAFTALVQRYSPVVLGVCQRVLGDFHAAQDASQATFVVLARKAGMLDRTSPLGGWLYKVAYHLALRTRATVAKQRLGEREAAFEEAGSPAPADNSLDLDQQELHQVLREELQGLPEKYRTPLALVYIDGRSHADAAQAIGLPRGSMAKRVGEGLDRLRERLVDRGLGL